ncbi:hypothetical protein [Mycolicibacterium komossense]|uniref:PE-PGRS family protein n=1 Tax=Mycolicibacterium komossense TaxID=1779 RepID=A0ABT3C986_9MYCO|nr:hypothetical protein [Mycolicibacterium komossense]MCV7225995.1 hypothetical protein [Mycolicibacterium komossense]
MEISLRPWLTTGVALVGAGAIAMAPVNPITATPTMAVPAISAPAVHTTAFELPYILTLPIVRQDIRNRIDYWVIYLNGLGQAGVGAFDTLVSIPQTAVTITQQLLQLDFVGALNTFSTAVRDGVVAVGQPLLNSLIERNQMALVIQTALQAAAPAAFFSVVNGVLAAGNALTTSVIVGTQDLVNAFLTLNLSNIVNAAIDGTAGFVQALGQGASDIVTGIESAQHLISDALASRPTSSAAAVPDLTKATVALNVDSTGPSQGTSTKSAVPKAAAPEVDSPAETTDITPIKTAGPAPTGKRSATPKAAPGSAVAAASTRAAHDAPGVQKKTRAGSSKD